MTADIVFDLHPLIQDFGESCTIVQGIDSEPETSLPSVLYQHFRRPPTVCLQFEKETFRPPPPFGA